MRRDVLEDIAEVTRPRVAGDLQTLPARERLSKSARTDPFERFMSKVDKSGGPDACWIWKGKTTRFMVKAGKHSGRTKIDQVMVEIGKYAWEQANGVTAPAKIFAQCRNGKCCNPRHLAPKHPGWVPGERRVMSATSSVSSAPIAPAPAELHDRLASTTLFGIIKMLDELTDTDRRRVLASINAFYPTGAP